MIFHGPFFILCSHHLFSWYCNDIVMRNSILVTHGSYRVKEKSSISAFNKTLYLLELRQVSCCESLGILCHLQIKFTEPKKKTSHIENNSQFSIETLILSLLQFLCSLISRFILSFAVFFFCLFHVFYINLELHIVSYLK